MEASRSLTGPQGVKYDGDKAAFLEDIRKVYVLTHPAGLVPVLCCDGRDFF